MPHRRGTTEPLGCVAQADKRGTVSLSPLIHVCMLWCIEQWEVCSLPRAELPQHCFLSSVFFAKQLCLACLCLCPHLCT